MFFTANEWQPVLRERGLDSVAAVFARTDGEVVARSSSTEVRRIGNLFIKKYWITKPSQIVSGVTRGAVFGKSKVRREFENLAWLRKHGFDAPAPVAYGEERRARCLVRSCLVSEAVDAARLDAVIAKGHAAAGPLRPSDLIGALADYVQRLHKQHFIHRDLFWRNILVAGERFYLIDAHKGGYRRGSRAHDLAALDAAAPAFFRRTERLGFLLRYLGHPKLTGADKALVRRVLKRAAPLRQKQLQRVRGAA